MRTLVIVKVCDKGHRTDLGPHIEAWELRGEPGEHMLRCPHCDSPNMDFQIGERP